MTKYLIEKAETFATEAHKGQMRKCGKDIEYITHPIGVAKILQKINAPAEVVAAGFLHDVVEDTEYTLDDIGKHFGAMVKLIVEYVSEETVEPKPVWKVRKKAYIKKLEKAPIQAIIVAAADKLYNLRETLQDYHEHGDDVWKIFNAQKESLYWYYTELLKIFKKRDVPQEMVTEIATAIKILHFDKDVVV